MQPRSDDLGLYCLLPVRNGTQHLAGYFQCAKRLGASIIALDDGSTDDTREWLENEPIVKAVLTNPVRPDYKGWDDAENRRRLLQACADFAVQWVLWLDADEVVANGDDERLREFLRDGATRDKAYGLEVLRMIGDAEHFDRGRLWVYRLFAYREGYTLPTEKLHFEPVPNEIAQDQWTRTRLRILHFSSVDHDARALRYRKYQEADPNCDWQDDYEDILDGPGQIWPVRPLPAGKSLLLD